MTDTTAVRIPRRAHDQLRALAAAGGETLDGMLVRLIEQARADRLLLDANRAYAATAADPVADREWQAEIALWDQTARDGATPAARPESGA